MALLIDLDDDSNKERKTYYKKREYSIGAGSGFTPAGGRLNLRPIRSKNHREYSAQSINDQGLCRQAPCNGG